MLPCTLPCAGRSYRSAVVQVCKHVARCRPAAGVAKGGQNTAKTAMRTATMGKLGGKKNGEGEGDEGGPKMPKASCACGLLLSLGQTASVAGLVSSSGHMVKPRQGCWADTVCGGPRPQVATCLAPQA